MKNLQYLELSISHADKTAAGDAEFKKLENLKELKRLAPYGWQITDASLPTIRGFEKLEFLDLRQTGVNRASAEQLKTDRPKCNIFFP